MEVWPLIGFVAFLTTSVLVPAARHWALRGGLLDVPNERSSHKVPKPRIGGVGVVGGGLAGIVTAAFTGPNFSAANWSLVGLLVGVAGVGLVDDMRQLSVARRMPLYLLGAFLLAYFCHAIPQLSLAPAPSIEFSRTVALGFTTLFIGWYANLFNFMDGTDGIAAGAAIVTCGALAVVFFGNDSPQLGAIALSLSGASIGFLLYNFAPSTVFMGDVGSLFLGTSAGALTAAAVELEFLSLTAGVLLMFPFIFDATFTLFRRAWNREKVWQAHRTHIYQQMCDLQMSHRNVGIVYTVAGGGCAVLGLYYDQLPSAAQAASLGCVLCSAGVTAFGVLSKRRRLDRS